MTSLETHQDLCQQFSTLLSYPQGETRQAALNCASQLEQSCPEAREALQGFISYLETHPLAQLEELFTNTFDLQPACHPYIGYQLCGESQQRSLFLMKLNELYQQQDFRPGVELPDHLSEVLRFLASINDRRCRAELQSDGLLPALTKIIQGIEDAQHPYKDVLEALQCFLGQGRTEQGALS